MNKQENPYKVPAGYFETLENKVQERITQPATPLFSLPKLAFSLVVLTLIGYGIWQFQKPAPKEACLTLACLDDDVLLEEIMTYDDDLVFEYAAEKTAEEIPLDYTLDDLIELEEYLL